MLVLNKIYKSLSTEDLFTRWVNYTKYTYFDVDYDIQSLIIELLDKIYRDGYYISIKDLHKIFVLASLNISQAVVNQNINKLIQNNICILNKNNSLVLV